MSSNFYGYNSIKLDINIKLWKLHIYMEFEFFTPE